MKLDLRKAALRASTALIAICSLIPPASAHTDSLGFIINPGASEGVFNVDIYYGSWHWPVMGAEGALDLSIEGGGLIGAAPFVLVPGFNGVENGIIPDGLTPGVNYFFPDYMGGFESVVDYHGIYAFQYASFLDLLPGAYQFGYNAGSSFTADWEPSDPMINAGAFVIGANGQLVIVGAGPPVIDTTRPLFTSDEFSEGDELTFDGGVLQIADGAQTISNNFIVNAAGGIIDANLMDAAFDGAFSGAGVITVRGAGVVLLSGENTHGGFLVNHAGIAAGADAALGAAGATLTLNHGSFTATQTMSIERPIEMVSNHGAVFNVGEDDVLTLNGAISGSSCLYKRGLGQLDLRANGSNAIGACVEEGEMAFNAAFAGNVWVEPGALMRGSGSIVGDVEVAGVLSPGNSPGVLVVAGDVTQLAGSTLLIEIDGPTAGDGAGHFDFLSLIGEDSVFTAGGELAPVLRGITGSADNTYTPEIGQVFEIVNAEGGVEGRFEAVVQPAEGLPGDARFDVIYGEDTIRLAVTAADYGAAISAGALDNARRAAHALQGVRPDAGEDAGAASAFFEGLVGYDVAELAQVFHEASGDIHAAALAGAHRSSRLGRESVLRRLGEAAPNRVAWGEAVGAFARIDGDRAANAYEHEAEGLVAGIDAPVRANLVLGGALSFVESATEGAGEADAETFQVMAYGRWRRGAVFAHALAAYGVSRTDIDRVVTLSSGVEALSTQVDGESFAVDLELGRSTHVGDGVIDALVAVGWERVVREDASESGAASVALSFGEEDSETLRLRAGGRYTHALQLGGSSIRPYGELYLTHTSDGAASWLSAELHGARFMISSPEAGAVGLSSGFGAVAEVNSNLELFVRVSGEFNENHSENAARIGARLAW